MDCCSTGNLLPLEEAKELLNAAVTPLTGTESRPIEAVLDKVLAEDIKSCIQVPGYDNSAMDGYAIRLEDLSITDTLSLVGKSFAGAPFNGAVGPGECVRIMTGAAVPKGSDAVVMQENTNAQGDTQVGDQIVFSSKPKPGANIRRAGEDIDIGDSVLPQGRRISPADIGLLASIGVKSVQVYRPVKVGIFSTGDELRLPGDSLDPGCIYDSNRFVVRAMLQRLGADILDLGIIPDNPQSLEETFLKAADSCDAIISSGGVSVGEADFTKDILDKIGEVGFWKVAIKPGKPFAFGTVGKKQLNKTCFFFGLPGNPVSATVTFHQLALPVLQFMGGENVQPPLTVQLPSATSVRKSPGRTDFQRGNLQLEADGSASVSTTGNQGSGILSSISRANCYLVLEREHGNYDEGETINVQPFDRWLG